MDDLEFIKAVDDQIDRIDREAKAAVVFAAKLLGALAVAMLISAAIFYA